MAARWIFVALAIVAVLAFFFLQRHPAATTIRSGIVANAQRSDSAALIESPGAEIVPQARSEAESESPADPRDEITLQVVDRANGQPVADAEVFFTEWLDDASEGYELHQRERGALTDWLEQHGHATRTNASGEAHLPRAHASETEFPATVFARHGLKWGLEDYSVADERVVLALEPERAFEVHVTSKEGVDAAGIDVVLLSLDYFGTRSHSMTDASGLARFRHLRPFLRRDVAKPCEVTASGLFVHHPQGRFASQEELPARVELVLPPCGSVDVELVGADGARIDAHSDFQFMLRNEGFAGFGLEYLQRATPTGNTRLE